MISVLNRKKRALLVCRPYAQHGNSALPYERHTVLKMLTQVSLMMNAPDACPHPILMKTIKESVAQC
jgi:hypothetical protein